ncbi:SRPBCC family protein [Flavobacterium sp.]|uniref:SRPBCC family protein n=1 Tax=Flavobacterium sp. TaxID=239 RepID=UPI0039E58158
MESAMKSKEKAIAGVTSGMISANETVTWRGKHFGMYFTHQSRITEFDRPHYFVDEMEKGMFKSFRHEHHFEESEGITTMTDILTYETPYGIFGKLFDRWLLKKHLTQFLIGRNEFIQKCASI